MDTKNLDLNLNRNKIELALWILGSLVAAVYTYAF